jgi:protein tyrosine phosphatase (PTP) superfamily phosphohydrolase (DUF442 family)
MKQAVPLLVALVLVGCESQKNASAPKSAEVKLDSHGDPQGLPRHRRWSEKIGQGAQPEGDIGFENLRALGYTTILSVDGSMPEVDRAAKFGLTYKHVPIGYDGVTVEEEIEIIKAVKEAPGPVYVHCHHGKHRGPAAAMIAREGLEGLSCEEAVQCLEISETSHDYAGLYRDVGAFKKPTDAQVAAAPEPTSCVRPAGVRATMVEIDQRFDLLKQAMDAGWKTPPKHPDVTPAHEARILWEYYREMIRTDPEAKAKGEDFLKHATEAEEHAGSLEEALAAGNNAAATESYRKLKKNCDSCHSLFRN